MGHAFITRSPFHQPLAPLLSLPTAEPSVPEVSVMGDNMSPRWWAGGALRARSSFNDYLIRLLTLDLKDERGTKLCLLPICSKQEKHRDGGEELENMQRGRGGRARIQPELRRHIFSHEWKPGLYHAIQLAAKANAPSCFYYVSLFLKTNRKFINLQEKFLFPTAQKRKHTRARKSWKNTKY